MFFFVQLIKIHQNIQLATKAGARESIALGLIDENSPLGELDKSELKCQTWKTPPGHISVTKISRFIFFYLKARFFFVFQ